CCSTNCAVCIPCCP
uniref:Conotoxin Fi3c n=1 Tax=Conus figulinus TaxID=101301 RepID=M3C_CONFI|nr:RecName: Full=Conotoxin Fi3c [Conus figulinus]